MAASATPVCETTEIFNIIGSFGKWQKIVFAIFFCVNTVGIFQNFAMTFLAPNMDFWCIEPAVNYSWTLNSTNLPGFNREDQCYVSVSNNSSTTRMNSDELNLNHTIKCTKWEYDTSYYSHTVVSEWDLVCDREWLVSLSKSIYMFGFLLSVFVFGQVSDCIGRFPTIVISYLVTVASLLLSLLSTSYSMFAILRFFQAFGRTGLTTVGFVLLMEIIGSAHRTNVGMAIQLGWSTGLFFLAGIGFFFRHWFWFQVAIAVPILPLAIGYKYIPESPRWLLMQRKYKKLEKVLETAAVMNKKEIKCDMKDLITNKFAVSAEGEKGTRKTVLDIFKTPKMRNRAFNMIYLWIVNAFLYYAMAFNTNDLAGDSYLNFFVSGALEFPSYAVTYIGVRYYGRRPSLVGLMLIGGAACGAQIFVPETLSWLTVTFAMIGRFCITGSFGILYLYTTELFPTVVRNAAIGTCSMFGRIGSIVAPFMRELGRATHPSVPSVVYVVLAFSSGLLALLLPETKDKQIPDTIEEGENFGE
ncbi:organic cation transporter protein-like [Uloborus diversus]|uniref:organic cation transporter protein-like n=1 Tax=Uloborus diversus TaxID=327109 RepID=UPI002409F276|nr:organic cation transporter protein-like [Uloborus diversus]